MVRVQYGGGSPITLHTAKITVHTVKWLGLGKKYRAGRHFIEIRSVKYHTNVQKKRNNYAFS